MAAGLGAAGAEDEANEDNHEDEHRDDGKEDPDNRGHLDSLNSCIKVKTKILRAASNQKVNDSYDGNRKVIVTNISSRNFQQSVQNNIFLEKPWI